MANPVLLHTRFLIPRPRPDHLSRPGLIRQLEAVLSKKLALVSAPPGYGKTTLLALFAHEASLPLAWYQLAPSDNDPKVFLRYVIEGLRHVFSDFGRATLALLDDPEAQVERIPMVFLNEVASSIEEDFIIVLEDYHWIGNAEIHRILDFLLDHQPPQMHFVISTRVEPPLALARLRGRGDLVELRTQDLRFTLDEVTRLTANLSLGMAQVRLLEEKTEGWAAGLQLVLTTLAQRPHEVAEDMVRHFCGSNRYVFDYLAEEVFQQQTPEVQNFLLRSSILTQMGAEICDMVLERDDSQVMLEHLESQNLFVVSLDQERRWYRYHQLFRDFLISRLQAEAEQEAQRLQAVAGDYYAEREAWDLAAEHYMQARNAEGLARAIRALVPTYLQSGRVEALFRYIQALPSSFANEEPDFLLYKGHVLHYRGQIAEAVGCYEEACDLYQAQEQPAKLCYALTQLARVAQSTGHYRQAQRLAEAAEAHACEQDHAERAEALMALAKTTGFLQGMGDGYKLGETAMREARLAGATLAREARARLLWSQAQLAWWYGDPFACVAYCQAALTEEGETVSPLACRVYAVMATPYLYWGDVGMARQLAERSVAYSEQLQFTEWLPMAYATLGNVLSRQKELTAGEEHLSRAIQLSRELGGESYAQLMASGFLAFNLAQRNRLVEARQVCEEALHLYSGSPETYELCVCRSVLGDVLLDMGAMDTAREYFLNLRHSCEARRFRLPLAMVYFALAYLHLEGGRNETALEFIRRSMEIIRHANAIMLYVDQGQRAARICQVAQDAGIYPEFAERVLIALSPAPAPGPSAALPPLHHQVADEDVIEVFCLGGFRLLHRGQELGKETGLTGRPREMLAYFITHRNQRLPLDRVVEDLWPDSTLERGQAVFHTTLYRVRQALAQVAGPGEYIRHESGEYQLEQERFRIDVALFESYVAQAQSSVGEQAVQAYEAAVELYKGPYLVTLYIDWCDRVRRRLSVAYLTALRFLTAHYAANGDYHSAILACERMLEADPLLEQIHCDLMRFWHRVGNRAGVVKQYQKLSRLLDREMDTDPMPETQALYAELVGERPR